MKENITTDLKTEGDKPEMMANPDKEIKMEISFKNDPLLVFGIGFKIKVIKSIIKPTCKPETDKMCVAPEY
ncbi:hypothetical protein GCM10022250_13180 [Flavobacterium chungbukense]|uniref:Uncharacterized protein n=1 Tax=Flavobacterium chungbukense TaxID=877464 RepID=A0ABP7XV00_9FLAO